MAKSGVSLNWGGLDKALLGAAKRLAERQMLMDGIGEMMVSSTLQRFEDEEGPDGKAWKPSIRATPSEDSRAPVRRGKDGRLLKGSGRDFFLLQLSFLVWHLVSLMLYQVLDLYVVPYQHMASMLFLTALDTAREAPGGPDLTLL